jgi:hypothetical protein
MPSRLSSLATSKLTVPYTHYVPEYFSASFNLGFY